MRPDPAAPLAEAAARRHELTRARAIQALREIDRPGMPVTFAAIAAAAGISRSWLYTQPDIRDQIQQMRSTPGHGTTGARPRQPARHRQFTARPAHRSPHPQPAARRRERPAPPPARPHARRPAVSQNPIR